MRRLLCVAALAVTDAAAKFALEKKGQKVLNVKLYETGYTFTNRGDKEKKPQTLREISGCSLKPAPKAFPDTSAPTPPEPYIEQSDDSVHVTLYSIAVLSLCALLVGVIAAAATHVAMKQKSVQMLERSKAPWQSYGSRDEEGAPLIAKRPSLSFSV